MKVLLRKGCSLLSADLSAALRRIPAASFRRTLESAFSYMEILVSGVCYVAARRVCLKTLLGDWEQFIAKELAERDYDAMNALLNAVELTVGVAVRPDARMTPRRCCRASPTRWVTRCLGCCSPSPPSRTSAAPSVAASCCPPSSAGPGVRFARLSRSKLFDNVCSKVQTLLDRHKTLHKAEKKPVVLADRRFSLSLSRRLRTGYLRLGFLPGRLARVASPLEPPRPSPLPRRLPPAPPPQPPRRRLLPRRQPRAPPGRARGRRLINAAGAAGRAAAGDAQRRRRVAQRDGHGRFTALLRRSYFPRPPRCPRG